MAHYNIVLLTYLTSLVHLPIGRFYRQSPSIWWPLHKKKIKQSYTANYIKFPCIQQFCSGVNVSGGLGSFPASLCRWLSAGNAHTSSDCQWRRAEKVSQLLFGIRLLESSHELCQRCCCISGNVQQTIAVVRSCIVVRVHNSVVYDLSDIQYY